LQLRLVAEEFEAEEFGFVVEEFEVEELGFVAETAVGTRVG